MTEMIKVNVEWEGRKTESVVPKGMKVGDLIEKYEDRNNLKIVAAMVNYDIKEHMKPLTTDCNVRFLTTADRNGNRIYQRGLCFVFIRAVHECFHDASVRIEHSINKGIYSEIVKSKPLTSEEVLIIRKRMQEIIDADEPFIKKELPIEEVIKLFQEQDMQSKVALLKYRTKTTAKVYSSGNLHDYFYGYMPPSSGYLKIFDLVFQPPGVVIRFPEVKNPFELPEYNSNLSLAGVFKEAEQWHDLIDISYVTDMNKSIEADKHHDIIRISEGLHEKKVAQIADLIEKTGKRIILIAGPTSSGKTSFAQRLIIQLKVLGIRPIAISTDDYFISKSDLIKDEKGNYDFEDISVVDTKLFNEQLNDLLEGKEVDLPQYDFILGKKIFGRRMTKLNSEQPIVIEGIHGLNTELTKNIKDQEKFRVYVSPLAVLNLDDHNRISTTDCRLLRRMVRDHRTRGHSARVTLKLWQSVRAGEEKNVFPYQEEADVVFNSTLPYELSVLKKYVEPLLVDITAEDEMYSDAKSLRRLLSYFISIDDERAILNNSIIKEFIGGSCFFEEE